MAAALPLRLVPKARLQQGVLEWIDLGSPGKTLSSDPRNPYALGIV